MLIHKHLLRGYNHAVRIFEHEINSNQSLKYLLTESKHIHFFIEENTHFLKELNKITVKENIEEKEISKLIDSFIFENENNAKKIITKLNQIKSHIPSLIFQIKEVNNNLVSLKSIANAGKISRGSKELEREQLLRNIKNHVNEILRINDAIKLTSEDIINLIKKDEKESEESIKKIKSKETAYQKIKRNMNSWFE